jgi:metallo-beta-lactamase family protein
MQWYGGIRGPQGGPPPLYLVHGEDRAREPLAAALRARSGAAVHLARPGQAVDV